MVDLLELLKLLIVVLLEQLRFLKLILGMQVCQHLKQPWILPKVLIKQMVDLYWSVVIKPDHWKLFTHLFFVLDII
jgi:hypothetical protein